MDEKYGFERAKMGKNKLNKNFMASKEMQRQKCEIYSRVVGYLSPVQRWNAGKKSEFGDRKVFNQTWSGNKE